jgi:hypothetical protein
MPANPTVEEIEYLRERYRLFREAHPAFMDRIAPDATFIFPTTRPAGGIYDGLWGADEFTSTGSDRVDDPHSKPGRSSVRASAGWCSVPSMRWSRAALAVPPSISATSSAAAERAPLKGRKATSFALICDAVLRRCARRG